MRATLRSGALLLVLSLLGTEAQAAEPPTAESAAQEALAAHRGGRADALKALAARAEPDPWLVADALLLAGHVDEAVAWAGAVSGKDVEGLAAFVAGWKAESGESAAREALRDANAALGAKDFTQALARFDAATGPASGVPRARIAFGRAIALEGLGRSAEASAAYATAAEAFERLGWLARASKARFGQMRLAPEGTPDAVLASRTALVELETRRGATPRLADAQSWLARTLSQRGQYEEALRAFQRTEELQRGFEDRLGQAATWNDIAEMQLARGDRKAAMDAATSSRAISGPAGLHPEIARSLMVAARVHVQEGKVRTAAGEYAEAAAAFEAAKDARGRLSALLAQGQNLMKAGDHPLAVAALRKAMAQADGLETGRSENQGISHALLALALERSGDRTAARAEVEAALPLAVGATAAYVEGLARRVLGRVLSAEGRFAEAAASLEAAQQVLEKGKEPFQAASALADLAEVRRRAGELELAMKLIDRAGQEADRLSDAGLMAEATAIAARVANDLKRGSDTVALARRAGDAFRSLGDEARAREMFALAEEAAKAPAK